MLETWIVCDVCGRKIKKEESSRWAHGVGIRNADLTSASPWRDYQDICESCAHDIAAAINLIIQSKGGKNHD